MSYNTINYELESRVGTNLDRQFMQEMIGKTVQTEAAHAKLQEKITAQAVAAMELDAIRQMQADRQLMLESYRDI